jgi:hypothetical protein
MTISSEWNVPLGRSAIVSHEALSSGPFSPNEMMMRDIHQHHGGHLHQQECNCQGVMAELSHHLIDKYTIPTFEKQLIRRRRNNPGYVARPKFESIDD